MKMRFDPLLLLVVLALVMAALLVLLPALQSDSEIRTERQRWRSVEQEYQEAKTESERWRIDYQRRQDELQRRQREPVRDPDRRDQERDMLWRWAPVP